jgi:hypothetical protein
VVAGVAGLRLRHPVQPHPDFDRRILPQSSRQQAEFSCPDGYIREVHSTEWPTDDTRSHAPSGPPLVTEGSIGRGCHTAMAGGFRGGVRSFRGGLG